MTAMKRNISQLFYSIGMVFLLCYSLTSSAARQLNLCMTNGTEKTIYTHISAIDPYDWFVPSWFPDTYRPDKNFDRVALTPNDLYCQKEIVRDSVFVTVHFDIAFSDTPDGTQWGLSRLKSGGYFLNYWQVEESGGYVISGRQGDGEADTFTISRPH